MRSETGSITAGSSILLARGRHRMIAEADGFTSEEREIAVEPGSDTHLQIVLEELGVWRKWWFWAILGGAVAAAGAATAIGIALAPKRVEGCHFLSDTCD
jgi:hypothetical protein